MEQVGQAGSLSYGEAMTFMARRELRGMCVVLFGMPAAGKSSLLGALLQAAQTQPGLLGGQLKDESGGLEELRERVYTDKSQETLEEIVPYPVSFKPQDKKQT